MKHKMPRRQVIVVTAFVAPGLIYAMIMFLYPFVYNIVLSFQNVDVSNFGVNTNPKQFVGFQNYAFLWQKTNLKSAIIHTFVFTGINIFFQITIGLLLALLFTKQFAFAKPIRALLLLIWCVPMTITAAIWRIMLQTDGGLFNYLLQMIGCSKVEWLTSTNRSLYSVCIANIWVGFPFCMILITAGLLNISPELYESAAIDGSGKLNTFFWITLPLLKQTLYAVLLLTTVYTFKSFDIVLCMTAGGPAGSSDILSTFAYQKAFTEYQFSQGAAGGCFLCLLLLIVVALYIQLMNREA